MEENIKRKSYKHYVPSEFNEEQSIEIMIDNENNADGKKVQKNPDQIIYKLQKGELQGTRLSKSIPYPIIKEKINENDEKQVDTPKKYLDPEASKNLDTEEGRPKKYYMMDSAMPNKFKGLIKILNQSSYAPEGWDKLSKRQKILGIFCCCVKKIELELDKEQELFKFFRLCNSIFNDKDEFHKSILFTYYNQLTKNSVFDNTRNSWKNLGFSSENYQKNELSFPNGLVSVLFLTFLYENKLEIYMKFKNMCQKIKTPLVKISVLLFSEALIMLRTKELNSILKNKKSPINTFFKFIAVAINMWLGEIRNKFKDLSEDSAEKEEREEKKLKIENSLVEVLKKAKNSTGK